MSTHVKSSMKIPETKALNFIHTQYNEKIETKSIYFIKKIDEFTKNQP